MSPLPDPEPICGEGEELIDGKCQIIADTCQGLDPCPYGLGVGGEPEPEPEPTPVDPCSIDPTSPDCETPEEPVVLPLVGENTVEVPNEPIEELPNDEELGEGGDDSEADEDNGSDDSEGSEESGESEDEAEDEESEQESEVESEEESGGGN